MDCTRIFSNGHEIGQQESYFKEQQSTDVVAHLLSTPSNKEEAFCVMKMIHNSKVEYLKKAIFELQRHNAGLTDELNRCRKQKTHVDYQGKKCMGIEINASDVSNPQEVEHLKEKIRLLENEVDQQRLLIQEQEVQVKSLLHSREKLKEKLEKTQKSQKNKVASEIRALLLEEKAKNILTQACQETERAKEFESCVLAFYEKFQVILLTSQAHSSQSRHNDLQRISELEKKLAGSLNSS